MNSNMEAGRELDCLIAEKVLGWPTIDSDTPIRTVKPHTGYICDGTTYIFPEVPPGALIAEPFHPSTRIQDAWRVVEKMKMVCPEYGERGTAWYFSLTREMGAPHWWWCCIKGTLKHRADTAPLAICIAAIRSVQP